MQRWFKFAFDDCDGITVAQIEKSIGQLFVDDFFECFAFAKGLEVNGYNIMPLK